MESGTKQSDEIRATLRFVGDNVDPVMITSSIGLQPSRAHAKGDSVKGHPNRIRSTGLWGLDSAISPNCSLEDHLKHLLGVIESRVSIVEELRDIGLSPNFYCGYFAAGAVLRSYIRLETDTLKRIAEIGASLDLHIYCIDD